MLMPSEGLVSMIDGVLFDKLVGLYALFFCMMLTHSRKRSHERLDMIRDRLVAFRSNSSNLDCRGAPYNILTSAYCHRGLLPVATSPRSSRWHTLSINVCLRCRILVKMYRCPYDAKARVPPKRSR